MSRWLTVTGLVVFVAVDVALVGAVVAKASSDANHPRQAVGPTSKVSSAPLKTATPSPSATPAAPAVRPAAAVLLSVARDGTVLTATRHSCKESGPVSVDVSTNLGKSYVERQAPVVQVLSLDALSSKDLRLVGTDSGCTISQFSSTDLGASWTRSLSVDTWFIGPDGDEEVVTPSRTAKPGCDVVSVWPTDASLARVACADGRIRGTGNGGKSWQNLGGLDGLRAAVFPAPGNGMALASFQGCAAQAFTTRDGGRTWSRANCISGTKAQAIAYNGSTLVALVSDQTYISTNRGASWRQP